MKLKKKAWEDRVKVYYRDKLNEKLVEKIINFLKGKDVNGISKLEVVKTSQGRWVCKLKINNNKYYIKKYFYRKSGKKIKNIFRPSEALRAFRTSHQLLAVDIPVVRPVLAAVYRQNLLTVDSILVTKDFGGRDLQDFFASGDYNKELKEEVITKTAYLWAQVYKNNFLNGDPNLASILVRYRQGDLELALIDVDNIRCYPFLPWKMIVKNLIDFNAHTYSGLYKLDGNKLTCEDRLIFLKNFINYYDKNGIEQQSLITQIKQKTIERLIEWDKRDLIINNESLNELL